MAAPRLPADTRLPWQVAQAAVCGCRGSDDYCPCLNENAPWKYGLGPRPKPPVGLIRSPMRDHHEITYSFPTQAAARAFRDHVQTTWAAFPAESGLSDDAGHCTAITPGSSGRPS